ncbi:xylulose kinase [Arthrobacter sp. Soil736]|uniref:xylulokinase n=1 Tax=Arthrobacter sp. Soil736 TaxID=1736395 RepID=UPI0007004D3D|nr:xylulokinase [Arthrobacter sp. Soil736]KRE55793.1 xylulose kinase [Arthrobacter sp. Soil736]
MPLVAGVDSSTQSCKVVIRDAETGALVRHGSAPHPGGSEVHPDAWWEALQTAIAQAGGLDGVAAISVGGQQHGMVCLDASGEVVRPALLWNDTRSAPSAAALIKEAGQGSDDAGRLHWARTTGTVPVASITATKLRWLAENEPDNAARTAAVCLPHDWLSWRLAGFGPGSGAEGLAALRTDRSDASGTGYWSPATGAYLPEVLENTLGHAPVLPAVLAPLASDFATPDGALIGPGAGDNAGAALGVAAGVGDVVVSIGTSGTVFAVADRPTADPHGLVAGFADATGHYLPLVCTLNASRVLDATAALLSVSLPRLSELALSARPGAGGLAFVPYFEGERTPNLPDATGSLHGMTLQNFTPENLARAAVEGIVCSLADGLKALTDLGVSAVRILLVGGGARSAAVQQVAAAIFGVPVVVPEPGEYVADGAARQAAGVLLGSFPEWQTARTGVVTADPAPDVLARYRAVAGGQLQ